MTLPEYSLFLIALATPLVLLGLVINFIDKRNHRRERQEKSRPKTSASERAAKRHTGNLERELRDKEDTWEDVIDILRPRPRGIIPVTDLDDIKVPPNTPPSAYPMIDIDAYNDMKEFTDQTETKRRDQQRELTRAKQRAAELVAQLGKRRGL